jgi:muramidase (phage lysozyme)
LANDNTTPPGNNPTPSTRNDNIPLDRNRDQLREVFDRYSTNQQNTNQRNNNTPQNIMNLLDRQRRGSGDLRNLTQTRLKSSIENRGIPTFSNDEDNSSFIEHARNQSQTLVSMDGKLEDLLLSQRTVQRDVNKTLYGILELLSRKNRNDEDGTIIVNNYYGNDSDGSGNILPNVGLGLGGGMPRPTPTSRPPRPLLPSAVSNFLRMAVRGSAATVAGVAATAAAIHGAFRLSDYLTPEDQKGAQRRAPEEVQTLISQNRNVKFTRDVEPFKSGETVAILQILERFDIPANQSVEFITQLLSSRQIELLAQETNQQQSIPSTPPIIPNNTETDIIRSPGESTRDFNRRVRENQERNLVNPASYTPEEDNDASPVDDDIDDNENILSLSRTIVSQITAQNQRQENETVARYRVNAQDYAINVQRTFTLNASRIIFNAENIEIHTDQDENEDDVVEPHTPVTGGTGGISSVGRIFSGRSGGGGNIITMGPGPGVGRGENGGSGGTGGGGRSGSAGGSGGDRAVSSQVPPEGRALLDAIAQGEGGRHGYHAINYVAARTHGPRFEDFSRHPFQGQSGYTAAGRYQMLWNTFEPYARRLGLSDFSPESQDRAAWALAVDVYSRRTRRNLEEDLKNPQMFEGITSALAPTWHALRGGGGDRFIEALRQGTAAAGQTQIANGNEGQGASITPTASPQSPRPMQQQVSSVLPTAYQPSGTNQRQIDAVQEEGEGQERSGQQQDAQPAGQGDTEGLTFAPQANPNIRPEIANIVRRVQSVVGPVTITSGYRDPARNSAVGGATNSKHMTGEAVDIQFAGGMGIAPRAIQVASEAGAGGIGVYDSWIHLDTGPKRTWQGRGGQPWAQQVLAAHMSGNAGSITPGQGGGSGGSMVSSNPGTGVDIARQSVGREVEQGTAENRMTAQAPAANYGGGEGDGGGGGAAGGIGGGLDIGSVHPAPGLMTEFSRESGQPSIIRPPAQMGMGLHRTPSFTA